MFPASREIESQFSAAKLATLTDANSRAEKNRRIDMRYQKAALNWKSSDGVSGTINATLAGSKTYGGRYFQITKDTTVDNIGPLWAGWGGRGGRGWGYWGLEPSPDFITHYTGRVVANLAEPSGTHMRCQFSERLNGERDTRAYYVDINH